MSIISFRRYLKKIRGGDKQKRDDCSQFKIIFSPNLNCRNLPTIISAWRGFRGKQRDTREKKKPKCEIEEKKFPPKKCFRGPLHMWPDNDSTELIKAFHFQHCFLDAYEICMYIFFA
jgi:hypothetical protein